MSDKIIIKEIRKSNKVYAFNMKILPLYDKGQYTANTGETIDKSKHFLGFGINFSFSRFDNTNRKNILLNVSEVGELLFSICKNTSYKAFHKCELTFTNNKIILSWIEIPLNCFDLFELKQMLTSCVLNSFKVKYNINYTIVEFLKLMNLELWKRTQIKENPNDVNQTDSPDFTPDFVPENSGVTVTEKFVVNPLNNEGGLKCSRPECNFIISSQYVDAVKKYCSNNTKFKGWVFCKRCQTTHF